MGGNSGRHEPCGTTRHGPLPPAFSSQCGPQLPGPGLCRSNVPRRGPSQRGCMHVHDPGVLQPLAPLAVRDCVPAPQPGSDFAIGQERDTARSFLPLRRGKKLCLTMSPISTPFGISALSQLHCADQAGVYALHRTTDWFMLFRLSHRYAAHVYSPVFPAPLTQCKGLGHCIQWPSGWAPMSCSHVSRRRA